MKKGRQLGLEPRGSWMELGGLTCCSLTANYYFYQVLELLENS